MIFSYYPGCSLETTAGEYNESAHRVFAALGVVLNELEDWNCCGATSAHSLSPSLAFLLPARNLAIAQEAGRDVVMPCAACFNRHKTVDVELRSLASRRSFVEEKLSFTFAGSVAVRPLLDVICRDIGLERIQARVSRPLNGLPVVAYYGCLLVRPAEITRFDDPENPVLLDELLNALGAEPCPWSSATDCCGGGLTLTAADLAARLVDRLIQRALEAGAQAFVTSCPLCQLNLEMRQARTGPRLPVFYFTELMGLAFDLKEAGSWWKKHLIDPTRLLDAFNL
jgi:heterodisulfide reductase subunit B